MTKTVNRKVHPPKFKVQVALDLFKEQETVSQICSRFQIHPSQAHAWKRIVLNGLPDLFTGKKTGHDNQEQEELIEELYKRIGEQQVALDWLKKKLGLIDHGKVRIN
jgi:transposase-like protein